MIGRLCAHGFCESDAAPVVARVRSDAMTAPRRPRATPEDATLIDVLIDGFEKNEILRGFHWRTLPLRDEAAAIEKFAALVAEARAWKGDAVEERSDGARRLTRWDNLQIRQLGRGVMVLVRAPHFSDWWHERENLEGRSLRSDLRLAQRGRVATSPIRRCAS